MKGVVFNLLETVVTENYAADIWDDLLDAADSDGVYTSLETYDDADLFNIVTAASKALALPPNDVIRWFGTEAMPHFKKLYPRFFLAHDSSVSFLATHHSSRGPKALSRGQRAGFCDGSREARQPRAPLPIRETPVFTGYGDDRRERSALW